MLKKHSFHAYLFSLISLFLLSDLCSATNALGYGYKAKYAENFSHFDYVDPTIKPSGSLTLASLNSSFDSFNPFILKGQAASGIEQLIFETLMISSLDEPYSIYGLLADDIQLAENGLSVTFHINPQARFSDNSKVTPDDVKFSFDTLKSSEAHPGYRIFWKDIVKATVLQDNHIRFDFAKENPELHMIISGLPVFSQQWLKGKKFSDVALEPPIGSGPYQVKDYQLGKYIHYTRNSNYWGNHLNTRKGMFNFEKVIFKYYKDRTIAREAFKAGEFDFISVYSSKSWAKDYQGKNFDSGKIIKTTFKHQNNEAIQGFVMNTRQKKFADKHVREALGLAFDFEWANRMLFYSQYTRCYSYFSNSKLAATELPDEAELAILQPFRKQLPPSIFNSVWQPPSTLSPSSLRSNLKRAFKLLKQAGWTIHNGVLSNPKGEPFRFHLMLASKAFERIAAAFARNLKKIGIAMTYRVIDQALYRRKLETFDFDMTTMRYGQKQSPGNELMNRWHSSSANIEGSSNHAGIKNPVIDALLEKLIRTTQREQLVRYARAIDRILLDQHYLIPQWFIPYHRVAFWNKFFQPKEIPLYYDAEGWMLQYWWLKK